MTEDIHTHADTIRGLSYFRPLPVRVSPLYGLIIRTKEGGARERDIDIQMMHTDFSADLLGIWRFLDRDYYYNYLLLVSAADDPGARLHYYRG